MLVPRSLLDLWYPKRNLLTIWPRDKRTLLLSLGKPREDMTKRNGVGPHAESGTPLFGDRLGQARHSGLRDSIVRLSRVPVNARRTRDIDNRPGLAVLDAEVRGGGAAQLEGCFCVQVHNGVPLLVAHFVNHAVVRVAGVVDNDVDLAAAECGGLADQLLDVAGVEHVARHGEGPPPGRDDAVGDGLCLGGVNVRDDDQGAFVGEKPGCFGADALAAARDDGDLAGEHALGVVEVGGDLGNPGGHDDGGGGIKRG